MKTTTFYLPKAEIVLLLTVVFLSCNTSNVNEENYKIASPNYAVLAEKTLNLLADFDLDSFGSMLSDDIEYEFPDGKKIKGKIALIDFWKNYKNLNGIESMTITSANYLPIDALSKPNGKAITCTKVVANFTNDLMIYKKNVSIKMNFNFYFNDIKMINHIESFYDQKLISQEN
jgi:hypothetical protein